LADAPDLGSGPERGAGSNPVLGINPSDPSTNANQSDDAISSDIFHTEVPYGVWLGHDQQKF
jgi:hypothetical protein